MKITINKEMKIKLLKAMRDGYLETDTVREELIRKIIEENDPFDLIRKNHGIEENELQAEKRQ